MLLRRIAWITALVLLFSAVTYRVAWSANAAGQGVEIGIVYSVGMVLAVGIISLVLGLLTALIPSRGQRFAERLWLRLPFVLLVTCLIGVVVAVFPEWYGSKHGMVELKGATYATVPTADESACMSVHDGVFENEGLYLERTGDKQFQRDKVLGEEEHLTVTWLSACEYELRVKDPAYTRRVKITQVDGAGYECVVQFGGDSTYAFTMRFDRVR